MYQFKCAIIVQVNRGTIDWQCVLVIHVQLDFVDMNQREKYKIYNENIWLITV